MGNTMWYIQTTDCPAIKRNKLLIHATMQIGIKISALSDVFKTMRKKKTLQPRIFCAARISFIFEEEIEFNE